MYINLQIYKFQPIYEGFKFLSYNAEVFCFIVPGLITFPEFENVETGLIWLILHVHEINTYVYYTLNSLSLFWLAENVQWIFEISPCDIIHSVAADYTTIIMSRTLKVKGNHVMYDRDAWFLRVIMSWYHTLCCLQQQQQQQHFIHSCTV